MALAGDLSEFPLTDLIQLIQLSKQTGGVHLRGERAGQTLEGWLYFTDGRIVGANSPGLTPLEAIYTFFTLTSGPFNFNDRQCLAQPTITRSNEALIMEGILRQEAWIHVTAQIPSLNLVPRLVLNPAAGSAQVDLAPDEWRIFTMINGTTSVAQLAQRSALGELRTCEIMLRLIESGLVELREPSPGEALAPEFERIASAYVGAGAAALLNEAYRHAGVTDPGRASPGQLLATVDYFERSVTGLLDPARAREAAARLRSRAQDMLGEPS